MTYKEQNRTLAARYAAEAFWLPELAEELFADGATMDFPNAPPGMPQSMDAFDTRLYLRYLGRTVSDYHSEPVSLYGTPDPDVFWLIREVSADVHWGWEPGTFKSRIFTRLELHEGKIRYLRSMWNPLSFLKAANLEIPIFRMDLADARIMAQLAYEADGEPYEIPTPTHDPQAAQRRILSNLELHRQADYFQAGVDMSFTAPDAQSVVWFLPPEMRESYTEQELPYVNGWTAVSCHTLDFAPEGRWWQTDDPHVYFAEFMCDGLVDWVGNHTTGAHYRNRYFYILHFDEYGRVTRTEEVLNPINKFNSIGVSLPTFPYYFR